MVIGEYYTMNIGGYRWLLVPIILIAIGGYSVVSHWCLFDWWLLRANLLMVIIL
jgi:hypothetical protein